MRIGEFTPSVNYKASINQAPSIKNDPNKQETQLELADALKGIEGSDKKQKASKKCDTCENRSYQDGSNDPGVSFKSPTKVAPSMATSAVVGHEMEHVSREQASAKAEGRKVVSQSVIIHSGICLECGKTYTSGGTTKTVTKGQEKESFDVGLINPKESGRTIDQVA